MTLLRPALVGLVLAGLVLSLARLQPRLHLGAELIYSLLLPPPRNFHPFRVQVR